MSVPWSDVSMSTLGNVFGSNGVYSLSNYRYVQIEDGSVGPSTEEINMGWFRGHWKYVYVPPPPPPPPPDSSCFVAGSLVRMSDSTFKPIEQVKQGEFVMSARTGEPVQVIAVDAHPPSKDPIVLWGSNGLAPWVTTAHTFLSVDGSQRMAVNRDESLAQKHWDSNRLLPIQAGSILRYRRPDNLDWSLIDTIQVDQVETIVREPMTLYNLITADHTYIVNHFCVFDDFPEIGRFPKGAMRICMCCELLYQEHRSELHEWTWLRAYEAYYPRVMSVQVDVSSLEESFGRFIALCQTDARILRLADLMWTNCILLFDAEVAHEPDSK